MRKATEEKGGKKDGRQGRWKEEIATEREENGWTGGIELNSYRLRYYLSYKQKLAHQPSPVIYLLSYHGFCRNKCLNY